MSLIKNYLYNMGYQLFILIVPFVTVPYISRTLGSSGVGLNAYTNSIIQYFILAGSIGINIYGQQKIAYQRDHRGKMSQSFWEISCLRVICVIAVYAVFTLFCLFQNKFRLYFFYQSFFIIASAFDISWFFMGIEDFKKIVGRNSLIKFISVIAIFLFVKEKNDLGLYILILSSSTLLGNITMWPYLKKMVQRPNFSTLAIKKHVLPSLALFVPQVATQVYLVLNKTMLGSMDGIISAGFYENSDKIVKIVLAIVTATGTVMLPRMASTFARGQHALVNRYLYQSFDFVSFICFPMAFGLATIAPKFAPWFLGEEFALTGILIPALAINIIFIGWSNVIGTQYLLPTNQTKSFTSSVVLGAILNVILNILLIPPLGIMGAIIATGVAEGGITLLQFYFVREQVSLKQLFKGQWKYGVSALMMALAILPLQLRLPAQFWCFALQVVMGGSIYLSVGLVLRFSIIQQAKQLLKINE